MSNIKKTWSHDNELFQCDSLGDLVTNYRDVLEVGSIVYVGDAERPTVRELCDVDAVIDQLGERARDIGGEFAEDFPDVTDDAKAELEAFLVAWLEKHCTIDFYTVRNVTPYTVTAIDLETESNGQKE